MQSVQWSVTSETELSSFVEQFKETMWLEKNNLTLLEVKVFFWICFNNYLVTISNKGG